MVIWKSCSIIIIFYIMGYTVHLVCLTFFDLLISRSERGVPGLVMIIE